jgi:ABC-2 type transport system ATP-binding protein
MQDSLKDSAQYNVIEAKGLTKVYGSATAVDHISFAVGRGEIFGLLGPNGAGKTTTILMMLGLTDISAGEVSVLGFNPAREPLSVKRRVGYLPDTVGFYDNLTAADNLRYTARLIGFLRAEREKRIADALERVGLADVADNRVGTFSRGMRQRLGLAEILMKGAQIAILDEPTSGLDPQATTELLGIIRAFKAEGVSVLLSSHLLERVQSVCDRVALFSGGKIALMGTVAELGREVLGGGYTVDIEADGQASPACRSRRAAGSGRRSRRHAGPSQIPRRTGAEPRSDLYALFRGQARITGRGGHARCSVRAQPFPVSVWSCSRSCRTT